MEATEEPAMPGQSANSPYVALFREIQAQIPRRKPFVVGSRTLSYGALFDGLAALTGIFKQLGLSVGDRAILCSNDDIAVVTIFMALLRNGITTVILPPHAPAAELEPLIESADARALFIDVEAHERCNLGAVRRHDSTIVQIEPGNDEDAQGPLVRALASRFGRSKVEGSELRYPGLLKSALGGAEPADHIPESTTAYILFTSGTTSKPKGVEISHRALFAQMSTFVRHYGLDTDTRWLNVLPLHHTDGLTQGIVVAFTAGATAYRPMRFRVDRLPTLLDLIYAKRITHFVTVPSVLNLILNLGDAYTDAFEGQDFRFVISTAAYLDLDTWQAFEEKLKVQVVNVYGLTETVCESIYSGPDSESRRIGTIGKPVDCEARIVDAEGSDVPAGSPGELILRGDHLMSGYFRMPEATAAVLKDGWFHTGDLAEIDGDGFYRIVGRKKDVIITAGINVYPEDVTRVLRGMPEILDAVTFAMPDPDWGERVVACVVPAEGASPTVPQIADYFLERASREKLPREIHIINDLPRGPTGKVIVDQVEKMLELEATAQDGDGSDGSLEGKMFEAAAKAFKTLATDLSLDSSPENTKGWSSLAHVELLLTLESTFSVRFDPQDIMRISSLADAKRVLESKAAQI
jgi:long-chain acyl-CoA synthetase